MAVAPAIRRPTAAPMPALAPVLRPEDGVGVGLGPADVVGLATVVVGDGEVLKVVAVGDDEVLKEVAVADVEVVVVIEVAAL